MKTTFQNGWSILRVGCAAMVLALAFTACRDKDEIGTPDNSVNPVENPIGPEDYVTVSAAGGTVEKDDAAVTFPAGTFEKDEKVGVVKVGKDTIDVEDKASDFYYMELPANAGQAMTISVKSEKLADDDVRLVTYVPSRSLHHTDSVTFAPISYETTYANGAYTATLPAFENEGADGEISLSFGLAHVMQFSSDAEVKANTRMTIGGETEGNLSWHYEVSPLFYLANSNRLNKVVKNLNDYMHTSIKSITDLGFSVMEKRDIPILFRALNDGEWGVFKQHPTTDTKSWIELSVKIVSMKDIDQDEVKQTIIHELFHYFQAEYDTRLPINKYRLCNGDELMMYESGGRWIEKFMNGGVPPLKDYKERLPFFMRGLNSLEEIYKNDGSVYSDKFASWLYKFFGAKHNYFDIGKARQTHGYAMGALLEYLSKEHGDKSIVDFYEDWTRNSMSMMKISMQSTIQTLNNFVNAKKSELFIGGYDKFVKSVISGKLIPGLQASDLACRVDGWLEMKNPKKEISAQCYPYGADIQFVKLKVRTEEFDDLRGKEVVIRNENPKESNLHTFVISHKRETEFLYEEALWPGDSLIIPADSIMLLSGSGTQKIEGTGFILATSSYESIKSSAYKLTVELRNIVTATPDTLEFDGEGGVQSTYLKMGAFPYYGVEVDYDGRDWCTAAKVGSTGEIQVTTQPNLTGKKRECIVEAYVSKEYYPLEEEKIRVPVKVIQQPMGEVSNIELDYFSFSAQLKSQSIWDYDGTEHPQEVGTTYFGFNTTESYEHPNSIKVTQKLSGTTLHVEATEAYEYSDGEGSESNTISFDITNFTGDYKKSKVTNVVLKTRNYVSEDEHYERELHLTNISYESFTALNPRVSYLDKNILTLKSTVGTGLQVTSASATSCWPFGDGTPVTSKTKFIPDNSDNAKLEIWFKPAE